MTRKKDAELFFKKRGEKQEIDLAAPLSYKPELRDQANGLRATIYRNTLGQRAVWKDQREFIGQQLLDTDFRMPL